MTVAEAERSQRFKDHIGNRTWSTGFTGVVHTAATRADGEDGSPNGIAEYENARAGAFNEPEITSRLNQSFVLDEARRVREESEGLEQGWEGLAQLCESQISTS